MLVRRRIAFAMHNTALHNQGAVDRIIQGQSKQKGAGCAHVLRDKVDAGRLHNSAIIPYILQREVGNKTQMYRENGLGGGASVMERVSWAMCQGMTWAGEGFGAT